VLRVALTSQVSQGSKMIRNVDARSGAVVHTCSPSHLGGRGRTVGNIVRPCLKEKKTKKRKEEKWLGVVVRACNTSTGEVKTELKV
jgi:hypothetical protein